ncbi:MAG: NUDIX hydrolase, partial [Candidatus Aenigmatarchaeota archaeon]
VLVEKRPQDDDLEGGKYHFPAGHVDEGETLEEAVEREMEEELGVQIRNYKYLRKLPYRSSGRDFTVHYCVCIDWKGKIKSKNDAGKLFWLSLEDEDKFSFEKDIEIVEEIFGNIN